jgi:hypothetical protein
VADLTAALEIARRGAGSEEAATNIANLLAKINSPTVTRAFAKNFGVDLPAALKAAYAQGKTPMEALAAITQKATGGDLSKLGLVVEDIGPAHADPQHGRLSQDQGRSGQERRHGRGRLRPARGARCLRRMARLHRHDERPCHHAGRHPAPVSRSSSADEHRRLGGRALGAGQPELAQG